MKTRPEPGNVLLWSGSHDVLGTTGPVILVEPTIDPQFWVVAELDEQGLPTPYTFAVPVEDLIPVEDLVPENYARGTPGLPGSPARRALLRVAVGVVAAASFALGAVSLIEHQPAATTIAEGLQPTPAAHVPNARAFSRSPRQLRHQLPGYFQAGSSLVSVAATGPRVGSGASALPSAAGGASGGGASGGQSVGSVATADTHPGNSGSAPGHTSTPGNSGSAPGHNSTPGNSGSAPGHNKDFAGRD